MIVKGWLHRIRRGHRPEWIYLGPSLKCRICDLGTPRPFIVWRLAGPPQGMWA